MPTIGRGAREIRIQHRGQYRVIYVTGFTNAVHVLHAFQKKTQKIPKLNIEIAKRRLHFLTEI